MTIKTASPTWKELKDHCKSAADYKNYMVENYGFREGLILGGIGRGEKIHKFFATFKIENNIIHIAGKPMSICGSAKWSSYLQVFENQEIECNCKRCK